ADQHPLRTGGERPEPGQGGRGVAAVVPPRRLSILSRYDDDLILAVGSPRTGYGRQQLRLFVASEPLTTAAPAIPAPWNFNHQPCTWYETVDRDLPRHRWDARHADELLTWYGLEPALHDQLVWDLRDTDSFRQAWAELGVDIPEQQVRVNSRSVLGYWYRLPEIVRAVRDAAEGRVGVGSQDHLSLLFTPAGRGRLAMSFHCYPPYDAYLRLDRLGVPLDVLLIHLGLLDPDHLHPLIHSALFPSATRPPAGPPRPGHPATDPVRVRCGGEWHQIHWQDGRVRIPHSEQEEQRETALVAFGGSRSGCFAAKTAMENGPAGRPRRRTETAYPDPWAAVPTPSIAPPPPPPPARRARLPRRLREQRRELMRLALHGDTEGVVSLLDAGVSAHVHDHRGRTLLHFMAHLRDLALLTRLLAEGLDVGHADVAGVTPLLAAAHGMGDVAVIRALIAAGARLDVAFATTGEPLTAWLEKARPDVHAAISDLEDAAARTARLDWNQQLTEWARARDEWQRRNP
ncbi:ankyrin repeat domain-containing protein, partial [Actinoplanes philippinensis]|uniref:ankyrin repeat domain-containing protein n=1 Tax=Actinoplanes philippinensis TaxID=35752 RepID=UPI003409CE7E